MPGLTQRAWALAATTAAPALRLMLRRRATRGKEDPARLPERRGYPGAARPPGRLLWIHAASVGETLSALPLLAALPPDLAILFTTGTLTSAHLLHARLQEAGLTDRVQHRFVPLDVPAWAARFLDAWRPNAACFLESELWPNLLAACAARRIPVALVNARLSARSARQWARAPAFARQILGHFAWIAAQSDADAARLRALGATTVDAPGNLKFAAPPLPVDAAELARLQTLLGHRPRWLAASTHPADDAIVAACHAALSARHPGLLTAIVPRHPERGPALAALYTAPSRAAGQPPPASGIWVADTLGELGLFYRCFPLVLIGKSFAGGGGQNPWEPAQLGCAILCGPDMQNFPEAVTRLQNAGALTQIPDQAALIEALDAHLHNPTLTTQASEAGRQETALSTNLPTLLAARLTALIDTARSD